MENPHCHDICCSYGAEVDLANVDRWRPFHSELKAWTGVPAEQWHLPDFWKVKDAPGRWVTRTKALEDGCVLRNRKGRGCLIHGYCLDKGLDYHLLKPYYCVMFPLVDNEGWLEVDDKTVEAAVCSHAHETAYRVAREELLYYYGPGLVEELDELEELYLSGQYDQHYRGTLLARLRLGLRLLWVRRPYC